MRVTSSSWARTWPGSGWAKIVRIAAATISPEVLGTLEHVAHEVHAAALPGRCEEHRPDRFFEAEVMVGDDELHAGESSSPEAFEERGPKRSVFRVADVDAEDFSVTGRGDPGRDHHGARHHPTADSTLDVGGVGEHIGELDLVKGPVAERVEFGVELCTDPGHFALGDP